MIAVIFYDLDFDVEHDSDSAHIYADVSVDGVYCFDSKEQARAHLEEMRKLHDQGVQAARGRSGRTRQVPDEDGR